MLIRVYVLSTLNAYLRKYVNTYQLAQVKHIIAIAISATPEVLTLHVFHCERRCRKRIYSHNFCTSARTPSVGSQATSRRRYCSDPGFRPGGKYECPFGRSSV